MDKLKLGVFHANQTSMSLDPHRCLLIHIWCRETILNPPVIYFLLTVPRQYIFCGSFVLFVSCACHAFASVH